MHFQDTVVYNREKDIGSATGTWFAELLKTNPWYQDVVPNFKVLPQEELLPGIDSATSFTSVCINTAIYLPWLVTQSLKNGVVFKRGIVRHINEASELHHTGKRADLIVNCTGLFSAKLGGVEDKSVVPARGQVVLVRNDPKVMASISGTDDGSDEVTYIMHRAAGKQASVTFQRGSFSLTRPHQAAAAYSAAVIKKAVGNHNQTQVWPSGL